MLASPPGAAVSDLVELDEADLREVAVRDLLGEGNSISTVQADPREPPEQVPHPKYGWTDHIFLAQTVYRPAVQGKNARELWQAICQWRIGTGEVVWDKTPGEAINTGVCPSRVSGEEIERNPDMIYALAEVLLVNHPRRDALLDEVRFKLADTIGGKTDQICFDENGHDPAVVRVNDGCYSGLWDPPRRYEEHDTVHTWVLHDSPLESRTDAQLALTASLLLSVTPSSPRFGEVSQRLVDIAALQTWRAALKSWPEDQSRVESPDLERAIAALKKMPKEAKLYARAQARIAAAEARLREAKAAEARAERERKAAMSRLSERDRRTSEASAAAAEVLYLDSLGPGQRSVYQRLGRPEAEEHDSGGGKVWTYREPIYSKLRDAVITGYRVSRYAFDSAGNLLPQ